ncbi:MAG: helix-turn-helix domain-containing protein [Mycobacteriales bacterium]
MPWRLALARRLALAPCRLAVPPCPGATPALALLALAGIPDDFLPVYAKGRESRRGAIRYQPDGPRLARSRGAAGTSRIGAGELGEHLGVNERATRRDVAILREADIPDESTRGPLRRELAREGSEAASGGLHRRRGARTSHGDRRSRPSWRPHDLVYTALAKVIRALPDTVGRATTARFEHT